MMLAYVRNLTMPMALVVLHGLSSHASGRDATGAISGAPEGQERLLLQLTRTGVDLLGTGDLFTIGFDRTSRSMGELWIRSETSPDSAVQGVGVFMAHRIHNVFRAIDAGDLSALRGLLSIGDSGDVPPPLVPSQTVEDFGWQDFDDDFGTVLWMPAADDDRTFLPMVWTCLGDQVEVAFPRTDEDADREPWQMLLRVDGQDFVSEVSVHDQGLTADYPVATGIFSALQEARELVIAPDREAQVVLPAQGGALDARDGFFAWCLAELE